MKILRIAYGFILGVLLLFVAIMDGDFHTSGIGLFLLAAYVLYYMIEEVENL